MTAAERAREEGRQAGLLEAATTIGDFTKRFFVVMGDRDADARVLASAIEREVLALAGPAQVRLDGGEEPAAAGAQETTARVLIVLHAHLVAREKFFKEERGTYQPPTPAAQEEARKAIREALKRHHETNGDREKWRKESAVLAAGVGIFYSEPHNGEMEKARLEELQHLRRPGTPTPQPKLYLELWRPWKLQKGKPDPVPGFADLCFQRRREADGR